MIERFNYTDDEYWEVIYENVNDFFNKTNWNIQCMKYIKFCNEESFRYAYFTMTDSMGHTSFNRIYIENLPEFKQKLYSHEKRKEHI